MTTHVAPVAAEATNDSPLDLALDERDRDVLRTVDMAVKNRQVRLAFQPVVSAAQPNRPAFYEGLARVLDDTGRPIPARDFINEIETDEIGRALDCVALELGLKALMANPELKLSINMSARSIGYRRWVQTLERGLSAGSSAMAGRLILEITEASAMVMPDVVQSFMMSLQNQGITFALDDFGAGYTSFRYLKSFYFDILKIDGQFIRGVNNDPDNQVLIEALVGIGRQFGMFTVAETVETEAEARYLTAAGVDCLQGYLYGAPSLKPEWTASA
ncbi:MAG: EAL domain-containing protein [Pseudomonadota bacterium]